MTSFADNRPHHIQTLLLPNVNIIAPFVETAKIWSDIVSRHIRQ